MEKVGHLIKREYDQIKVFNYIFVQRFFLLFCVPHVLSFERVLSVLFYYFFLINTGFSSFWKRRRNLDDKGPSRRRLVRRLTKTLPIFPRNLFTIRPFFIFEKKKSRFYWFTRVNIRPLIVCFLHDYLCALGFDVFFSLSISIIILRTRIHVVLNRTTIGDGRFIHHT